MATELKCPIIFSLRDTSFEHLAAGNALNAYQPEYLNLSLPSLSELIKKRLSSLKELWHEELLKPESKYIFWDDGQEKELSRKETLNAGIKILDFLMNYANNEKIIKILSQLSNYCLRELDSVVTR